MALNTSKYPPRNITDILTEGVLLPEPLEAQAGDPAVNIFNGDSEWSEVDHQTHPAQEPRPVTIHIDGVNLVDIIADLQGRVDALEV